MNTLNCEIPLKMTFLIIFYNQWLIEKPEPPACKFRCSGRWQIRNKIMKKNFAYILIAFSTVIHAQNPEIIELNFVGHTIHVPENCKVKSETEIMCNGTSTKWRNLENEMEGMGEIITEQLAKQYQNAPDFVKKTELTMNSFGSELNGYKFQFLKENKNIYFIALSGTVNNQSIVLYIGTMQDIKETGDLNELQKQMISFE